MNPLKSPSIRGYSPFILSLIFLASSSRGFAHPGHGPAQGIYYGFAHPLSGWDHVLAMIAVGIWAAELGASKLISTIFLCGMALGGLAGHYVGVMPGIDQGIAASVLVLGLMIARAVRLPTGLAATIIGAFAVFHGFAHGVEMPLTASGLSYGAGFLAASALLIAAGTTLDIVALRRSQTITKYTGWALAGAGVLLATL